MKKVILICIVTVLFGMADVKAGTWTTISKPGAALTQTCGMLSNNNIVGQYNDLSGNGWRGFTYNGTAWTSLNAPGATQTWVHAASGNNIAGSYENASGIHGFIYNGSSWTTINAPNASETYIHGVSGNTVVGYSYSNGYLKGFMYNGTKWSYPAMPGAKATYIYGIDGSSLVGQYDDTSWNTHCFLYDGTTWSTLNMPCVIGISGNNVVGFTCYDVSNHGLLYNGTTYTTLDYPGASSTELLGINGDKIFGYYDTTGEHGFIYTIPEPCTLLLLGLGGLSLLGRRRK